MTPHQQRAFLAAVAQFVEDLQGGGASRKGLRVKGIQGAAGLFEMTWAPDGRATFEYGDAVIGAEPHIVWRRVGTHAWILRALTLPGAEYLLPVLFPSFVRDAGNALGRTMRRAGLPLPKFEEQWRSYASLTEPGNRHAFMRTLRSVIDPGGQTVSAHDRLYLASRFPTLIAWGRHDRIIPPHHASAALEAIPGSRLVIFEESGHFPHTEEPQRFVEVLTDFVKTTEPPQVDEPPWRALLTAGLPT